MVRTMEAIGGISESSSHSRIYENGIMSPIDDESISDFSIISHPNEPESHGLQGGNLDYLNNVQFPLINQPMSMSNTSTSTEDIQQQLREIVKENVELKEALKQNNSLLRQHFSTIVNWQEQYNKARIRQKELVDSMREATETLQEEKLKLTSEMDEMREVLSTLTRQQENVKLDLGIKDKLLKEAEQEIERLKPELEIQNVRILHLEEKVGELQSEKALIQATLKEEKSRKVSNISAPLMVTEEDMGYAVVHSGGLSYSCDEMSLMRQSLDAMLEEKTLFVNLLNEEQEQTKKLKLELDAKTEELDKAKFEVRATMEAAEKLKEEKLKADSSWVSSLTSLAAPPDERFPSMEDSIIDQSIVMVNGANAELQKCQDRFTSINDQLGECQERLTTTMKGDMTAPHDVEGLWNEVIVLRTILSDKQEAKENYKKQLEESQKKFHHEYELIIEQWENYISEVKTQGKQQEALTEIEKRKHQESLDELTAKTMYLEESLQEKERDIDRIKKQVKMLEREIEQIPILRSRNELFQIELQKAEVGNQEKDAQLESYKKENYSLQTQVVQLMDEVNQMSQKELAEFCATPNEGGSTSRRDKHKRHSKSTPDTQKAHCPVHKTKKGSWEKSEELLGAVGGDARGISPMPYEEQDPNHMVNQCPRCFLAFKGITALSNHVDVCLKEDTEFL